MVEGGDHDLATTYCNTEHYLESDRSNIPQEARCWAPAGGGAGCCRCAPARRASPLTCLTVCFLVLTYNLLGGFLFLALEGNAAEETAVAASKPNLSHAQQTATDLRSRTVERLWSITEDLNILYKENWTKLAAKELMDFQKVLIKSMKGEVTLGSRVPIDQDSEYRWTFSSSFLYALTLITTIGHGNVTPKSSAGKLVAIAYACVGIPIIMLYLSTIGDALARNFRALYARLCPARLRAAGCPAGAGAACLRRPDKPPEKRTPFQAALNLDGLGRAPPGPCRAHARVPAPLGLLVLALYVALGALVFHGTEDWPPLDGCYFSFSSLATIGFGSLRPGRRAGRSPRAEDAAVGVCCVYILVGIVVVAMCFNLIQEDMRWMVRGVAALCAGGGRVAGGRAPGGGAA